MGSGGDFNHLPELLKALHDGTKKGVVKATKEVKKDIQSGAAVATGYMRDSAYTVTSEGSDYQGGAKSLPEVGAPGDDLTGIAAVAAEYAVYVERGTSKMGAQPFVTPAAESMRGRLPGIIANAVNSEIKDATK